MRFLSGAGAVLRQWRHPREFRIAQSAWPADALTTLTELARSELARAELVSAELAQAELAQAGQAQAGQAQAGQADTGGEVPESQALPERSVADVATSLWRLRGRMERMDDPPRAVVRHLETAWDALSDAGVEVTDHAGDPFDPGLALSVVAYQPTPGLRREQIIETVRPGVYLGGRSIQMAEVIVGTPESEEARTR